jgi:hypothetical protein
MTRFHTIIVLSSRRLALGLALAMALAANSQVLAQTHQTKPSLFVVSAGISKYARMNQLQCAHKDALDVAALFQGQADKLFGRSTVVTHIDAEAKVANIVASLQAVKAQATPDSQVILYLAGHGATDSEYLYCAYDRDWLWSEIKLALRDMPGKVMVILDTCGAGGAVGARNLTVFCGCLAEESGMEDPTPNGNGHFTKALIEGLNGKADLNGDGIVTLDEVQMYVAHRLHRFSNDTQHAKVVRPEFGLGSISLSQVGVAK